MRKPYDQEVTIMDIKSIKTDADYRAALLEIERLMLASTNSQDGAKFDVLVALVEAHEAKYFSMERLLTINDQLVRRLKGLTDGIDIELNTPLSEDGE